MLHLVRLQDERCADLLTERECEILDLVMEGLANKQIAAWLCISPWTVKVHLANIYAKLDVRSRTQAATLWWRWTENIKKKEREGETTR